jgi:hypothetical protein
MHSAMQMGGLLFGVDANCFPNTILFAFCHKNYVNRVSENF